MFKKFSKLILLSVGVLTIFAACSINLGIEDSGNNNGNGDTFLDNVAGKSFNLVTEAEGTENYVNRDGDITSIDGRTVLYHFEGYKNNRNGVYSNGYGNYFGVKYVSDASPLKFYFNNIGKPTGDYWSSEEYVQFESGYGVMLATSLRGTTMMKGSIPSESIENAGVKTSGVLSSAFSLTGNKLYTLVDKRIGGTLYTGTVTNNSIQIDLENEVANPAITDMTSDSLQLIGGEPYIITPNTMLTTLSVYDKNGALMTVSGGPRNKINNVNNYAIGSSQQDPNTVYIATNNSSSSVAKLYKVDSTGINSSEVFINESGIIPQSVALKVLGTTDVYVAGHNGSSLVVQKIAGNGDQSLIADGALNTSGRDIRLFVVRNNLHAIVGTSIYKSFNDGAWVKLSGTVPSNIFSVIVDDETLYFTLNDITSVAYKVSTTANKIEVVGLPSTAPAGLVGNVAPAIVGHISFGILIVDVEKINNINHIIYNNYKLGTGDIPFVMPAK